MSRWELDQNTRSGRSPDKASPLLDPQTEVDHYRIIRPLGRGGTGQVYLARDTKLGRKVALKMIRGHPGVKRPFLLRFLIEARTTARFNHPHIVTIHAVGEYEGQPYLALEYLPGETLRTRLRTRSLGTQEVLRIGTAIASALVEAHTHGILHLDLKPGNIIITKNGHPKVLDFGLAQHVDAEPTAADLEFPSDPIDSSSSRFIIGTPSYLAPEQWQRQPRTPVTDIWALGIIIFEMLTGRRPFEPHETSLENLRHAVLTQAAPPLPSQHPAELVTLIAACLEPSAKDRPNAQDILSTLEPMLHPLPGKRSKDENPFRGLFAFTARHAHLFFGRDQEIAEAVERLTHEPILAVVGASGAGKSSLVQAGIIPRILEQDSVDVLLMRPGHHPFRALSARILGRHPEDSKHEDKVETRDVERLGKELYETPSRLAALLAEEAIRNRCRIFLIIDQLEELFTLAPCADAQRFMQAIALTVEDAEDPVRVIFTVRDDYLSRIATAGPLVRSVLRRMMLVQVPEHAALNEVLVQPIKTLGYAYESQHIIEDMIKTVDGQPSSLPLLQFAAVTLWQRRDTTRRLLTQEAYEAIGGVQGALAKHADGVLDILEDQEREMARQLLSKLVTSEHTRRVVDRSRLLEGLPVDAERILDRLIEARLVSLTRSSTGEQTHSTLELAHESLIYTWQRLRDWLDASQEERRFIAEVEQAATLWEKRGCRIEEVWTGAALTEATLDRNRCTGAVPVGIDRFLDAGRTAERRQRFRRQALLGTSVLLLILVSVGLSFGLTKALRQQRLAEVGKAIAEREGAASALVQGRLFESRAKVRTSLEIADALPTRALWWKLSREPLLWSDAFQSVPWDVVFSPDAQQLAVATQAGRIHLYDIATRNAETIEAPFPSGRKFLAYAPSGRRLAFAGFEGGVGEWSTTEHRWLWQDQKVRNIGAVSYSPDESLLYGSVFGGKVQRWRTEDYSPLPLLTGPPPPLAGLAIRFVRNFMLEGGFRGGLRLWDIEQGRVIQSARQESVVEAVDIHPTTFDWVSADREGILRFWTPYGTLRHETSTGPDRPRKISYSPDGRWLAIGGYDGYLRLLDADTGTVINLLRTHESEIVALRWSPNGRYLASGGRDRTVVLLDGTKLVRPKRIPGHDDRVNDVIFSHDGQYLVTGGQDQSVRIWNADSGRVERVITDTDGPIQRVAINHDDTQIAWASQIVGLTDFRSVGNQYILQQRGSRPVYDLAFAPSGSTLVATSGTRSVAVYDVDQRRLEKEVTADFRTPLALAFDPSTGQLGVGDAQANLHLLAPDTYQKDQTLSLNKRMLTDFAFSPDGRFVASIGVDRTLRVKNILTNKARRFDAEGARRIQVDISPDGTKLAVAVADKHAQIWDMRTGTLIRRFFGPRDEAQSVRFSPDGRWLAVASIDTTLRLFEVDTGRPRWWSHALLHPATLVNHLGWIDLRTNEEIPPVGQWAQRVKVAWRAVDGTDPHLVCLITMDGQLEFWDRARDRNLREVAVGAPQDLWPHDDGCVVLAEGRATLFGWDKNEDRVLIETEATALSVDKSGVLVAQTSSVTAFSPGSTVVHHAPTAVTASRWLPSGLFFGLERGALIERTPTGDLRTFDRPFAFPITRIAAGPPGTILAGAADGSVGLWDLDTKLRLHAEQLHGPIAHLVYRNGRAYAVSEMGDFLVWDLEILERTWCDLVSRIQGEMAVVWHDGRTTQRAPTPPDACR